MILELIFRFVEDSRKAIANLRFNINKTIIAMKVFYRAKKNSD